VPEDLDQLAALAPKDIQIAGVGVALQRLLEAHRQKAIGSSAKTDTSRPISRRQVINPVHTLYRMVEGPGRRWLRGPDGRRGQQIRSALRE
jgi:hypothetical protein